MFAITSMTVPKITRERFFCTIANFQPSHVIHFTNNVHRVEGFVLRKIIRRSYTFYERIINLDNGQSISSTDFAFILRQIQSLRTISSSPLPSIPDTMR